jgi:hypothetical protein
MRSAGGTCGGRRGRCGSAADPGARSAQQQLTGADLHKRFFYSQIMRAVIDNGKHNSLFFYPVNHVNPVLFLYLLYMPCG